MALKKLQVEIDKTFKKVTEGVDQFEELHNKLQAATSYAQREKYEGELKREIKKLQRHRDQIKSWIASPDIKDKKQLMDNRVLIEKQMERFKAIERELKTKAYSKEGLSQPGRVDPLDALKGQITTWLVDQLDRLSALVDKLEAESEQLQAVAKRGKKVDPEKKERLAMIERQVERHKYQTEKLEVVQRALENGNLQVEKVQSVQEDVEYYLDQAEAGEFPDGEGLYDDLDLDEAELGTDDDDDEDDDEEMATSPVRETSLKDEHELSPHPKVENSPGKSVRRSSVGVIKEHEEHSKAAQLVSPVRTNAKPPTTTPTTTPRTTAPAAATTSKPPAPRAGPPTPVTVPPHPSAPGPLTAPAQGKVQALPPRPFAAVTRGASAPNSSIPGGPNAPAQSTTTATPTGPPRGYSAVAAAVASSGAHAADEKVGAAALTEEKRAPTAVKAVPASKTTSVKATSAPSEKDVIDAKVEKDQQAGVAAAGEVAGPNASNGAVSVTSKEEVGQQLSPTSVTATSKSQPAPIQTQSTATATPSTAPQATSSVPSGTGISTPAQPEPPNDSRLPPSLEDLVNSFEAAKARTSASSEDVSFARSMLEVSFGMIPEPTDSEKPRKYVPKAPYPTPLYYPQTPSPLFEDPLLFERFDIDTLFFIFYYQQGTYQQFLAARELKRQSWRFHKKYLTWFQRHEEPKVITDEYEQGTYIYFDYEGAWVQRKKTDFRFEYRFLEDAEV
ncbi:hypothetical protein M427DRAFT_114193 [Gonapodya prolifera JEL478]|uniref:General negative regulator of transcription subunit n=1 Tax=Gonapodya prolifera (strain JEL478) TaxID=1344416 RepID=A0A139A6S0_GONPJ|nr:hypothetical protein M427DRAFT_114193 [Gonapodya prolifera JEL478]|eukprot:KXS12338.1 hypothetical protein M427DRAFT_114193 [Gonapodya prolifera JEL478]